MFRFQVLPFIRQTLIAISHALMLIPVFFFFMELNRVPNEQAVFTFLIVTQLLAVLFYKWWVFIPIQILHVLYGLYRLFPPLNSSVSMREWLSGTQDILVSQSSDLIEANLVDVPELLIFTLLFVLISLLTTLAVHKKWALPSFLVPFSYLMVVHTFTDNRILSYMVVLVGVGFLFIALTKMQTDMHWTHFIKNTAITSIVTFAVIGFSAWGIDRFRSSQEWVEVQFYPYQRTLDDNGFFSWINTYSTGLGYQRTGFGLDDAVLGGPLHQDFTPLFRAYTDEPNYWKVLHRTEYTGSGWENNIDENVMLVSEPLNYEMLYPEFNLGYENMYDEDLFSNLSIQWYEEVDYIAYPYGWSTIALDSIEDDYALEYHNRSNYYTVPDQSDWITHYSIYYDEQFPDRFEEDRLSQDDGWREIYNEEHRRWLEETDEEDVGEEFAHENIVSYFFENELQVPDSLPQRVADLAEEITEGLDNEYDMVRAIENYLKADGGYRYSLLEVERTPEGEDYIDYFLFESLIGYCDNFSSAMTIMLRTLGIPARWTKGFSPGDFYENGSDQSYFRVSNANAHSWVEVYFPSFGWVPFEPSPSFANPVTNPEPVTSISQESYVVEEEDYIDLEEIDEAIDPVVEEEDISEEPQGSEELRGAAELSPVMAEEEETGQRSSINWSTVILSIILSASTLLAVFFLFRWKTFNWTMKQLVTKSRLSLEKYVQLVLFLYRWKKKRLPGQTIEAYLNQWKPFLPNDEQTIDEFISLANLSFYSPNHAKERMSEEQNAVIVDMLDVYKKSPNLKKAKKEM